MASETTQVPPKMDEPDDTTQLPPDLPQEALNDLVEMLNLLASARDAMSDQMVSRIARTAADGMALLDRVVRNEGLLSLLQVLDRPETQHLMMSLADALGRMSRELAIAPPARGGYVGLLRLASEPGTQEGIRALSLLGKYWNDSLRELHRTGGR